MRKATKTWGLSSAGRASALQAEGHRFEPYRPHLKNYGWIPEWPKGADCKSVGNAFEGSNPSPSSMPMWLNWQSSWFVISRLSVRVRSSALSQKRQYNLISRGGAVWKLVGLITRRSQVQILFPLLCPDSSVGRAEDWKSSCRWFDSGRNHHYNCVNSFYFGHLTKKGLAKAWERC